MEEMDTIWNFLIGATGISAIIIFLGKWFINLIGKMGLEKYRNDLEKENLKFQNSLDQKLEKFKIQFSKLHIDQAESIKELYRKLIKAESSLEFLLRPLKINPTKTEEEAANEVVKYGNEFFEFFVTNEIIFSENTCEIIGKIRTKYLEVWSAYSQKAFVGNDISPELNRKLIDDMKNAYQNVLEKEMQDLKTELKKDFRIQLGIINKETGANTR